MRPQSIVNFERAYLGVIAVNVLNAILTYTGIGGLNRAAGGAGVASGSIVTALVGIGIQVLLWYFIAKKGAVVAKWVLTVLFALGLLGVLFIYSQGLFPPGILGILTVVGLGLQAIAIYFMFRPDSQRWFDGKGDVENTFR